MHRDVWLMIARWLLAGALSVAVTAAGLNDGFTLGPIRLVDPVSAALAGLIVLVLLAPWRVMAQWSEQRQQLRKLRIELRDVSSGRREQPLESLLVGGDDEISRLSQAVHDALKQTVALRIHAHALQRNLQQHIERETNRATAKLTRQTLTDPLTGLGNRRLLEKRLEEYRERAPAGQPPNVAAILIDIDRFKQINDVLGHDVGDKCLTDVGQTIGGCLRQSDCAARLGGDEFVILLDRTGIRGAERVAERIVATVNRLPWPHARLPRPTLSIGIAEPAPGDALDAARLLRKADAALYASKRRGRATITVFDQRLSAA